jgi:hypothetical protein
VATAAIHQSTSIHQKPSPQDERESLAEFVARVNASGGMEARGGLQAIVLGFPSFITITFIDDVLQSIHHPYVLQSL